VEGGLGVPTWEFSCLKLHGNLLSFTDKKYLISIVLYISITIQNCFSLNIGNGKKSVRMFKGQLTSNFMSAEMQSTLPVEYFGQFVKIKNTPVVGGNPPFVGVGHWARQELYKI
jgi:hypothetical protein